MKKPGRMTVGKLARAGGVAATTVRYYERAGLLAPPIRTASGYRLYGPETAERLQFIRSAQAVGFTLDDIKALLEIEGQQGQQCRIEVQELLTKRLAEVDARLRDLKKVRSALGSALSRCRDSNGECAVLKGLHSAKGSKP